MRRLYLLPKDAHAILRVADDSVRAGLQFDRAVLITADSDQIPAVKYVRFCRVVP